MAEIKTFVFFDIETTGLDGVDPAKITELAFIACSKDHLLSATKKKVPRVIHKLLIPVNPMKVIHPESTRITGLDNFMLEHIKKFDAKTVDLMNCFFNQLIKPVCLVAHNGNQFDYPILKRQLKKLGCSFDEELLCVDSLEIFKKIDEQQEMTKSAMDDFLNTDLKSIQQKNEKTPSKGISFAVISRAPYDKPTAAKRLFDSPTTSASCINNSTISQTPVSTISQSSARNSYKLTDIFKRLHGHAPDIAHNAEADAMHLLMCVIVMNNEFIKMADSEAKQFINF